MEQDIPTDSKDMFEKRVAITIAIIAIIEAITGSFGDSAADDAILAQTRSANAWSYYQAKSLKENFYESQMEMALILAPGSVIQEEQEKTVDRFRKETERYKKEKSIIKSTAEDEDKEVAQSRRINDRLDLASIFLQLGIVIASIGILTRWKWMWHASICLGFTGLVTAISVYLL